MVELALADLIRVERERLDSALKSHEQSLRSSVSGFRQNIEHQLKLGRLKDQLRELEEELTKTLTENARKEAKRTAINESLSIAKSASKELFKIVQDQKARRDGYAAIASQQSISPVASEENKNEDVDRCKGLEESTAWYQKVLGFHIEGGHGVRPVSNYVQGDSSTITLSSPPSTMSASSRTSLTGLSGVRFSGRSRKDKHSRVGTPSSVSATALRRSPRFKEDDFGGDFNGARRPGSVGSYPSVNVKKRGFGEIDDDDYGDGDLFGKGKVAVDESAPGAATGMILSLRESLQNCKEDLTTCQMQLEEAKLEIQKWHSACQNESIVPTGTTPEPALLFNYLQNLKSSESSLKEQLEKAKKKEAAFVVTFAKREQEMADLKSAVRDLKAQMRPQVLQARRLLLDPAIHEEFTRLKNLVEEKEKKIKELEDNVTAISFTPHSKNGKSLMTKCKILMAENEEIGISASEGKVLILQEKLEEKDNEISVLKEELSRKEVLSEERDSADDEKKVMEDVETNTVEVKSEAET
ncbi:FKBP12-interacting protein of 37 kDa [Acorus calamus]|uniref:FKBP12-interacting protein of 37 kDa n=1 Tax=Acorus calamus TaxID=4465 RepID=A0AAV9DNI4_ACOCL|nr:FKBP12-interacting protein of 37 kDa [Acorus calamus]